MQRRRFSKALHYTVGVEDRIVYPFAFVSFAIGIATCSAAESVVASASVVASSIFGL
jgi:hypothetical protein